MAASSALVDIVKVDVEVEGDAFVETTNPSALLARSRKGKAAFVRERCIVNNSTVVIVS